MVGLQFVPFTSSISPDFWHALTRLKLHVLKLNDEPVPISAYYQRGGVVHDRVTGQDVPLACLLHFDAASFDSTSCVYFDGLSWLWLTSCHRRSPQASTSERAYLRGKLINYNTIEDFKKADKIALLNDLGQEVSTTGLSVSDKNPR